MFQRRHYEFIAATIKDLGDRKVSRDELAAIFKQRLAAVSAEHSLTRGSRAGFKPDLFVKACGSSAEG
jgi:hypothetical protein